MAQVIDGGIPLPSGVLGAPPAAAPADAATLGPRGAPRQGARRKEIDHRAMKLIVGSIAILMAPLAWLLAYAVDHEVIDSVSASYWQAGPAHVVFIGFLFAIAAFLFAYRGYTTAEDHWSTVAALAAVCIAVFPCSYPGESSPYAAVHYGAATVLFLILAWFCWGFYRRARDKQQIFPRARRRARIYIGCAAVMLACIAVMGLDEVTHWFTDWRRNATFIFEGIALIAFGVCWFVAGRFLRSLTDEGERYSPRREVNPE